MVPLWTLAVLPLLLAPAPTQDAAVLRLSVALELDEAEALLAILERRRAGAEATAEDWRRLEESRGFVRMKQRAESFGNTGVAASLRAYAESDETLAQLDDLRSAVERFRSLDVSAAAARALLYLPEEARLQATIYPVVKPSPNSYVYDLSGEPAIFLHVDPARSGNELENTIAHELHHVGSATCADPDDVEALSPEARLAWGWLSAFGEGMAMLAAAGGPDVHPHASSPAEAWVVWERDLAHLIPGGFLLFAILRAISGAAAGLAYSAASAAAAQVSPYRRRGATMGWFSAGMFLAIPIGMPLTVALAAAGSWQAIFGFQALIGAFAAISAWRTVPADVPEQEHRAAWSEVLTNGQVRAGLLATLLHVGSFFTVVQLATVWLDDTGLVPKEEQIYLWVGLGLLSVFGSAGLGRLSDRVGKRAFVLGCSAVLVACFGLLARQPAPLVMLGVATALALAAAARTGPLQALVSGLVPDSQLSTLMGLRSASMQLGAGLFALIAAPVAAELHFEGILWLAALCQVGSYAAIRFGVRKA